MKRIIKVWFQGNIGLRFQRYEADHFVLINPDEANMGVLWLYNNVHLFNRETVASISTRNIKRFSVA